MCQIKRGVQAVDFSDNIYSDKIYSYTEFIKEISAQAEKLPLFTNGKGRSFYNIPCALDIETSSFMVGDTKCACMYVWQLGINGMVCVGRTWVDLIYTIRKICEILKLDYAKKRLIIYVHNLGYEFQFLRKYFEWKKVFALDTRKPCHAITDSGIEFKCSYILSGYSLAKVGTQLHRYKFDKMVGDLDYSKIRHSETPLTDKELLYCVNDVRVIMAYIQEKIEEEKNITEIPLTKTGYVRRACRNACLKTKSGKSNHKYRMRLSVLTIEPEEYEMLKRAFMGGYTHANALYVGDILQNVSSFDLTSSYPTVMIAEKFPMSKGHKINIIDDTMLDKYLNNFACVFDCKFEKLEPAVYTDNPISQSRCINAKNCVINNGRIVSADEVTMTITNVDFEIISKFYKWDKLTIGTFYTYRIGYLPKEFITTILDFYEGKTVLKDVEGKEVEYLKLKELLNSLYGMTVTDICRDEIVYEGDGWKPSEKKDVEAELKKYNKSKNRFLFYPWGVFVTAYARRNLFSAIYAIGEDYVYSDTDSVKLLHYDKHKKYFEKYNENIISKLKKAMDFHGISYERIMPKNIKGNIMPMGIWSYEGTYTRFKTLGAKRYMTEKDKKVSLTVSGVNKHTAIPYLLKTYGQDKIFDIFANGLYIPPQDVDGDSTTGKNILTYCDDEIEGYIVDYLGNRGKYRELSYIHMTPADYTLSLSSRYLEYLFGLRGIN